MLASASSQFSVHSTRCICHAASGVVPMLWGVKLRSKHVRSAQCAYAMQQSSISEDKPLQHSRFLGNRSADETQNRNQL